MTIPASRRFFKLSGQGFMGIVGIERTAPMEARKDLRYNGSEVEGANNTAVAPKANDDRQMAPTFSGLATRSRMTKREGEEGAEGIESRGVGGGRRATATAPR